MVKAPETSALTDLRKEIDRIDEAMHQLLIERGEIIDRLIAVKRSQDSGTSAFRPAREAEMMRRLVKRHKGILPLDTVESIWRVIISTFTFVQAPFSVHASLSENILQIFTEQQAGRVKVRPPRLGFHFFRYDGECDEGDVRQLMVEFGHRARHVPVRRHDDQRIEIVLARPTFCFERVAEGIERRAVQVDAAGKIFRIKRGEARDFACTCGPVHPGYQQPFAVFGGQQFDRVGNARSRAGKHDDAVGLAIERYLIAGNLGGEPAETACQQQSTGSAGSHRQESDPAGKTGKHDRGRDRSNANPNRHLPPA